MIIMIRLALTLIALLVLLPGPVAAGESLRLLHEKAMSAYRLAGERFGLALGQREAAEAAVRQEVLGAIASLLCVGGDRDGCLEASRAAGRELGPYAAAIPDGQRTGPASFARGRAFLEELLPLTQGWGLDRALVLEGLGWLARIEGDHLRQQALGQGRPQLRARLAEARKSGRVSDWLAAAEQSALLLEHRLQVQVGRGLADFVLGGGGLDGREPEVAAALDRGLDALSMLGETSGPDRTRLGAARARVNAKALSPSDLEFALGPAAERFQTDLRQAQQQLGRLAGLAPQRSRPAILLQFLASYAGVLAAEPQAAHPLGLVADAAFLTDPYLANRARGLLAREALLEGDYHRAAEGFAAAVGALGEDEATRSLRGLLLAGRAQALFYLGDLGGAAATYAQAAEALVDRPEAALKARQGQAQAALFKGAGEQAESGLAAAAALLPRVPVARREILALGLDLDRALGRLAQGQHDEALAGLRSVAATARERGEVRLAAVASTNLAELHNDGQRSREALAAAEAALAWLDPASQADVVWQAWCEKGRALAALGEHEPAEQAFERAMTMVETLRSQIPTESARRSFAAAKQRLYRTAVAQLIAAGRVERAFQVAERARGRAFLDMLGERQIHLGAAAAQQRLGPKRARLLKSLPAPRSALGLPGAALRAPTPAKGQAPVRAAGDPRQGWLSLVSVNPAQVADVASVLGRREGLLSFFHDGERLHGFLIVDRRVHLASVPIGEQQLANRVRDLLRSLRQPAPDDRRVRQKSLRLWQLTLAPLAKELAGLERLVVVPWGPLHYVPFSALYDGQGYTIDSLELSVVPSGSALVMIRSGRAYQRKIGRPEVLALGNPATDMGDLPASAREADLLARLFPGSRVYKGRQATKKAFVLAAAGRRLIHLASHGVFLPERPMSSYLALAGPTAEDGRLSALEILGLDLGQARLVTLSACSSGEVEVERGDEVVGLSRAFLHAGAPALLASLWPLADEGALEFVGSFYRGLKKGQAPVTALTRASRALKRDARFAHPFYWAAFSLVGS